MIVGFKCIKGEMLFKDCPCAEPCKPLAYLNLLKREVSKGHASISITSCLSCLFKSYILTKLDFFIPLEAAHSASFRGSLVHGALSDYRHNGDLREETFVVDGISGTPDYYDAHLRKLFDWKTCKGIYPEKLPYSNHRDQVLAYAYMLEQNKYPVEQIEIFYISFTSTCACKIKFEKQDIVNTWTKLKERAKLLSKAINGATVQQARELIEPSVLCNGQAQGGKIYCWCKKECDRARL